MLITKQMIRNINPLEDGRRLVENISSHGRFEGKNDRAVQRPSQPFSHDYIHYSDHQHPHQRPQHITPHPTGTPALGAYPRVSGLLDVACSRLFGGFCVTSIVF
jgi:hypothetical protein